MQPWTPPGGVRCLVTWSDGPRLFVGATTQANRQAIETEPGFFCNGELP